MTRNYDMAQGKYLSWTDSIVISEKGYAPQHCGGYAWVITSADPDLSDNQLAGVIALLSEWTRIADSTWEVLKESAM